MHADDAANRPQDAAPASLPVSPLPADASPESSTNFAPGLAPGTPPDAVARLPLHVHARGLALGVIATVAFLYALQWAKEFLVPLLLGIFIAYTLNPLVCWLERIRIARPIGATLVTAAILCGSAITADKLHGEFQNIMEELPTVTHKLSRLLSDKLGKGPSTLERIQAVATEIEQAASGGVKRTSRKAIHISSASSTLVTSSMNI